MMIVPRSFSNHLAYRKSIEFSEKGDISDRRPNSRSPSSSSPLLTSPSPSRATSNLRHESRSDPVRIPSRSAKSQSSGSQSSSQPAQEAQIKNLPARRESTREILASTAIPLRRKPRGRLSQRLPQGDHVTDFSKLLWTDMKPPRNGSVPRSISASNLDALFGSMDELLEDSDMFVGSEGVDAGILSKRNFSHESLTSAASRDELGRSDDTGNLSPFARSTPDRKLRQIASSVDCSADHPLSKLEEEDDFGSLPELSISPPTPKQPIQTENRLRLPFKSSLTASLKAIKAAAQSVSSKAATTNTNPRNTEKLLAHSFFDIQPSLTDDRRPPPSLDPPSAEMRRYLNPPPLESAAQLHFWQDHRHSQFDPPPPTSSNSNKRKSNSSKKKKKKNSGIDIPNPRSSTHNLPSVVPLATCLPSSIRTAHASSPPIWLAPDGTPTNKNTSTPLLHDPDSFSPLTGGSPGITGWRNREPRENRDFLRVYVMEMDMRRKGKLSEDLGAGRARLWLPPVLDGNSKLNAEFGTTKESADESAAMTNTNTNRRDATQRLRSWLAHEL